MPDSPAAMSAAFETFIAPARARPQLWRLLLGLLVCVVIYALVTAGVLIGAAFLFAGDQLLQDWSVDVFDADTPEAMLTILATFAGMAVGPMVAVRLLHGRRAGTLFGRGPVVLRHFAIAAATTATILALSVAVWLVFNAPAPGLDPGRWIMLLPLSLAAVLLQTGAEELLFRGYLQQQLAARFRSPLIWAVFPSLVFGALHLDPAGAGENALLVAGAAALFGLYAADLTARTGSIGAAWGFHFVNNTLALLFLATDGALSGIALWKTPYEISDAAAVRAAIPLDLAVMTAIWLVLRRLLAR